VLAVDDDELACEDVKTRDDCERLNELELHGSRYFAPGSPQRRALAEWVPPAAWQATHPPRPPTEYPICDDGPSWRERCDAAMADDSGTDAADDW
jgi:hypothetical protein